MNVAEWTVLVVEDESDSMEVVQEALAHHGIKAVGASSAEEALKLLDAITPTLIIIDLALPGMDGWALLKQLRKHTALASLPLVAITAYHTAEVATRAIDAGFDAYFSKPLDATSFVRELEGVVAG